MKSLKSYSVGIICLLLQMSLFVQAEVYTIGVENDAAPWSFNDGSGYLNDLVTQAFAAANQEIKLQVLPYARCKSQVIEGNLLACFTTTKDSTTEPFMVFPDDALIIPRNVLFVKKDSPITCDQTKWPNSFSVAIVKDYEYVPMVASLVNLKVFHPTQVYTEGKGLEMLAQNRVEAALVNVDEVKSVEFVAKLARVPVSGIKEGCDLGSMRGYLAFSKKHKSTEEALQKFNLGYKKIVKTNEVIKLQKLWTVKLKDIKLPFSK